MTETSQGSDHGTPDPDEERHARAAELRALADSGETISEAEYRRRSRRSVLLGGLGALAGFAGWRFVQNAPADGNVPTPVRGGLQWNEALWTAVYSPGRTVREYDLDDADPLRVNGTRGMLDEEELDLDGWTLRVEGPDGARLAELDLDDVRSLGEIDLVVNHKCIEGWSNVTHWTGVPFATFAAPFLRRTDHPPYVAIETVDRRYYVGLDRDAAVHPQVLLGTGLDGDPLTNRHGAPLRLVSPIHYGIKSIKQIGTIRFQHERPRDFWAERGYDWHSQH